MARPPKEINWKTVKAKIEAGCPAKEIFSSQDCQVSEDTFYRRFKEEFGCNFGDYAGTVAQIGMGDLRLMLHAKAMQGNITSLIFLAKCRLGMTEPEIVHLFAPKQNEINQEHIIMQQAHEIEELKKKLGLDGNKPQTE